MGRVKRYKAIGARGHRAGDEFIFGESSRVAKLNLTGEKGIILERYYTLNEIWKNYAYKVKVLSGKKKGKVYCFNSNSPLSTSQWWEEKLSYK